MAVLPASSSVLGWEAVRCPLTGHKNGPGQLRGGARHGRGQGLWGRTKAVVCYILDNISPYKSDLGAQRGMQAGRAAPPYEWVAAMVMGAVLARAARSRSAGAQQIWVPMRPAET